MGRSSLRPNELDGLPESDGTVAGTSRERLDTFKKINFIDIHTLIQKCYLNETICQIIHQKTDLLNVLHLIFIESSNGT